jgi:hypothetical protein
MYNLSLEDDKTYITKEEQKKGTKGDKDQA